MHIHKSLADVNGRLTRAREELRIVEEQLLYQMDVVEEARTRMLVAETPLADREFRIARDDLDRLARQRRDVASLIEDLRVEQDRLLDRMLNA
ncbi:MAG TPA: hypothetical protein VHJ34_11485 [Actinomycetota bacterium]|nr:hypothetical protein [Actinomycetota bacterium]